MRQTTTTRFSGLCVHEALHGYTQYVMTSSSDSIPLGWSYHGLGSSILMVCTGTYTRALGFASEYIRRKDQTTESSQSAYTRPFDRSIAPPYN